MKPGKCYIGTSGWSYAHWAKGQFYPKGLKQGEWLGFFAKHFSTVEVNASFYRLPTPEMITRWREVSGSRFRLAVKLWRRITHERRLANCDRELQDFLVVVNGLGPKRGPLLVQLPPSMGKDVGRLDTFLSMLEKTIGRVPLLSRSAPAGVPLLSSSVSRRTRWRVTVEFRKPDWLCKPVYDLLDGHGVALCLADLSRCPITEPNDVGFVYIRRHGPGGPYRSCYSPEHIADDAKHIRDYLRRGKDVYVYYNNDAEGYAIDNARQLIAAVGAD